MKILRRGLPEWYQHFDRVFNEIVYDPNDSTPGLCLIAHTWSKKYGARALVFLKKPSSLDPVEMAETLRHESDHILPTFGGFSPNFHTVTTAGGKGIDHARDPIYVRGRELRPRLEAAWREIIAEAQPKPVTLPAVPAAEPTWGQILTGIAAVALFAFGFGALAKALPIR